MEAVDISGGPVAKRPAREDLRVRAFGQFIRLYRRHIRRLTCGDPESGWDDACDNARGRSATGDSTMVAAVRMLPLELREALLIVVLAGFTHEEAAAALDIPFAALITRLTKARERIAALTRAPTVVEAASPANRQVPHLRIVK